MCRARLAAGWPEGQQARAARGLAPIPPDASPVSTPVASAWVPVPSSIWSSALRIGDRHPLRGIGLVSGHSRWRNGSQSPVSLCLAGGRCPQFRPLPAQVPFVPRHPASGTATHPVTVGWAQSRRKGRMGASPRRCPAALRDSVNHLGLPRDAANGATSLVRPLPGAIRPASLSPTPKAFGMEEPAT